MNDTDRPCAIVTGAASGIGAATAAQLAATGFDLVVNYASNSEGAAQVADRCRRQGARVIVVQGDIANDTNCRSIAAAAVETFGRIDVLVNNAGVTRYAPAEDLEASNAADFERIFGVNVLGSYQMIRAAAPHLRRSSEGAIVNVSSHSGMNGDGSSLAYAASKGALNTMTIGLARSLAPAIRVNAVCPGFVDTTWSLAWQSEDHYADFRVKVAAMAALKSIPSADDVAESIVWLAGPKSRCITGQLLVIDSGTHLVVASPL